MFWCVSQRPVKDDSEVKRAQSGRVGDQLIRLLIFLFDDYIDIGCVFSGVPQNILSITHSLSSFSLGQ